MERNLVLSIFPGIDLLGMGFEREGWCVVRGPDVIFGGDIRDFHPPAGVFGGIIGGDPCQAHSQLNAINRAKGITSIFPDMTPEFARVIGEAQPAWFIRENVLEAPELAVEGYAIHRFLLNNRWIAEAPEQNRRRRFEFGTRDGCRLDVEICLLENPIKTPAVTAQATCWVPIKIGGSGKSTYEQERKGRPESRRTSAYLADAIAAQGLPAGWLEHAPWTQDGKIKAIGNGVPLPMAQEIARAVRRALALPGG